MNFGSLHLTTPEGHSRDVALTQAVVAIGRAETNQLFVEHPTVSRQHARLTVTAQEVLIEDLESNNGTFIEQRRLEPHLPTPFQPQQTVRVGEVALRYSPPPGGFIPSARLTHSNDTPVLPAINLQLTGPTAAVMPGQTASARLVVHNHEKEVDEFILRLSGAPAEWATVTPDHLPLKPEERGEAHIVFQPPRAPTIPPQAYLFYITVISRYYQSSLSEPGTLTVLPFADCAAQLEPEVTRGEFTLTLTNRGNVETTFAVSAEDDANALLIEAEQDQVTLAPGAQATIAMRARPHDSLPRGAPNPYPFTVRVQAQAPAEAVAQLTGYLSVKTGPLAWWKK